MDEVRKEIMSKFSDLLKEVGNELATIASN